MAESITFNEDCMAVMARYPDKYFDLSVVDPPYGAGFTEGGGCQGWFSKYHQTDDKEHRNLRGRFDRYNASASESSQSLHVERERETDGRPAYNRFGSPGSRFERYKRDPDGRDLGGEVRKKIIAWDVAPGEEYFKELFRVSRNQIIWGGNYFTLPPTRCFLVWRKLTISESFTMAMAEYAWTSFNSNAKVFEAAPQAKPGDNRFHPTQKPVELYAWQYKLFAKPGFKILDTHMGSQSSRIAAWDAGLDYVGCEIDETYFKLGEARFEKHTAQGNLFLMEQDTLF